MDELCRLGVDMNAKTNDFEVCVHVSMSFHRPDGVVWTVGMCGLGND